MVHPDTGPWRLVDALTGWAASTLWVDWLLLGGSLGRGAGDERSDVDAGLGVRTAPDAPFSHRRDAVLASARALDETADTLVQPLGTADAPADHLVVQYRDGRQLSVVVSPAESRHDLPPETLVLLDRSGRLGRPAPADRYAAAPPTRREWAFLGWVAVGDAHRHACRGRVWRALRSLDEARASCWRLWAADHGVTFPAFGVVSVENAGIAPPPGLERTHPPSLTTTDLLAAVDAVATVLGPLTAPHDVEGIRDVTLARLRETVR